MNQIFGNDEPAEKTTLARELRWLGYFFVAYAASEMLIFLGWHHLLAWVAALCLWFVAYRLIEGKSLGILVFTACLVYVISSHSLYESGMYFYARMSLSAAFAIGAACLMYFAYYALKRGKIKQSDLF